MGRSGKCRCRKSPSSRRGDAGGTRFGGSIPENPISMRSCSRGTSARLVADLDGKQFEIRHRAEEELERQGDAAELLLRQTLAAKSSLHVHQRLEALLQKLDGPPITSVVRLRSLRALEVLEYLNNAEAREILQSLAAGLPQARLTKEAKAVLQRRSTTRAPAPSP